MVKKFLGTFVSVTVLTSVILASNINNRAFAEGSIIRIAGVDYYKTAVAVSQKEWATSDVVVLASSVDFPDALSGTSLAISYDAPVLFTGKDVLNDDTLNELQRLKAKKVYILGGIGSISQSIEGGLKTQGLEVIRLSGQDRFKTAVAVGDEVINKTKKNTAFITNAYGYADALSGATFAGKTGSPVLLTEQDKLNEDTKKALTDWKITNVYILGGSGVLSQAVEDELKSMGISIQRLGGANRYDTAQKIVKNFDTEQSKFTLVTGTDFHNALASASFANKENRPIVLYDDSCDSGIKEFVKDKDLVVVGNEIEGLQATLDPNSNSNIINSGEQVTDNSLLYVNGKAVGTSSKGTNDTTYVPLQVIVEGMGDEYQWDMASRKATIMTKDGKQIQLINGFSVAFVSGKKIPIDTKVVNDVKVPVDNQVTLINGAIYVPINFVSAQLGYPVTTKTVSGITFIYVGTVPADTPTPTPTNPTQSTTPTNTSGVAGTDAQANLDWLAQNVGLYRLGNAVFYNPDNYSVWGEKLSVSNQRSRESDSDVFIQLMAWDDETPSKAKAVFKFYLPTQYETLYNMINESYEGTDKYIGQTYTLDSRGIHIVYNEESNTVGIAISMPRIK